MIETLQRGLRWLYDAPQPDDAVLSHHGITLHDPSSNRSVALVPLAARRPGTVIVLDVAKVRYDGDGDPTNPLAPGELEALAGALADLGCEVVETWNGHPTTTGSVRLRRSAHPTLIAAVERYHAGCPEHPERSVFCDCGWYRADLVQRPADAPTTRSSDQPTDQTEWPK